MVYHALKAEVYDRGPAPDAFLDELIAWGKAAPDDIFAPNPNNDIYAAIEPILGPWRDNRHRRAVMIEVMRVLAGFESSWNWDEGRDVGNPKSITPETIEAGAWQVSADSMEFADALRALVLARVGSDDGDSFQAAMKSDHDLAMEYIARLLRYTITQNQPTRDHEIDPWLSGDAVEELLGYLI
ncbi:MAG: hypothetical protein QOG84_313 [Sphingomonadales bacterium]|jgi:hypothetical protein|nr:hypothetical protein [Sphingomonadales bacterium]